MLWILVCFCCFQVLRMMTFVKLHMKSFWLVLGLLGKLIHLYIFCIKFSHLTFMTFSSCHLILNYAASVLIFLLLILFIFCYINSGLIVPSKEKRKDKKSRLMKKLGRSKNDNVVNQSQRAPGLVGLLETMRVQMEVF